MDNNFFSIIYEKFNNILTSFTKSLSIGKQPKEESVTNEIEKYFLNEKGIDRIKELLKIDEQNGERHEYFNENIQILSSVAVSGFILGSILESNESLEKFKRNNQLSVYTDKKTATRAFVDHLYLQTIKGGTKYAFKFASFSGMILGSSMLIQAYRNKSSPLDYTIGGAISGGLFRLHYGLLNFMIGTAAGGIFGTIFGLVRYTQMKMMNLTYEERRYHKLKEDLIEKENLMTLAANDKKKTIDN
ncbi:hypothetical protein BpHYR1_053027 [Brachionus plicatilis]|uniref:Complex I assembly factor TIMMDC1, mitochondrial n=2 Tax=Brachionus plicatilis TaxID=10195 RepID=A0A3M7T0P6_BRAPC|nr:hypothetical protein BpHYR1_053027 [Brachionus plicatilis]